MASEALLWRRRRLGTGGARALFEDLHETITWHGDGDDPAAATLLDRILASDATRSAAGQVQALVLRADLAIRMDDQAAAERLLGQARRIRLTSEDRATLGDDLRRAEELAEALAR